MAPSGATSEPLSPIAPTLSSPVENAREDRTLASACLLKYLAAFKRSGCTSPYTRVLEKSSLPDST